MQSQASTVADYIDQLPEDRRVAISKLRSIIRKNLPKGFAETMSYGMITYVVPHRLYPAGYHCDAKQPLPFLSLASQKNHMAIYLMTVYMQPELEAWVREGFATSGKKLDMGKSCIRFKKLDDLPLDVIGEAVGKISLPDYIIMYEDRLKLGKSRNKKVEKA